MISTAEERLKIGAKYFYPGQGVVVVESFGKSDFGLGEYYELRTVPKGSRIVIPLGNEKRVREIFGKEDGWRLLGELRAPNPEFSRNHVTRKRNYKDRLSSGKPEDLVLLLREDAAARAAGLKSQEGTFKAEAAKAVLAGELNEAFGLGSVEDAEKLIDSALKAAVAKQ